MDAFEDRNKQYRKQLIKIGGNKALRSRSRVAMFVVSFASFKSRALFCLMPRAEMRVRAQASRGNITVLYRLNHRGERREI